MILFQQPTVSWQFQDELFDPTLYESRTYRSDYNVTVHELTIPRAREEHAGSYQCVTPYGSAAIYVDMLGKYNIIDLAVGLLHRVFISYQSNTNYEKHFLTKLIVLLWGTNLL